MTINNYFKNALLLTSVICITSCASPTDKIIKENGAQEIFFFGSNGEFIVVDKKSGKIIPTCSSRLKKKTNKKIENPNTIKLPPCKNKNTISKIDPKAIKALQVLKKRIENIKDLGAREVSVIVTYKFTGSICRTIEHPLTGISMELCRPPL